VIDTLIYLIGHQGVGKLTIAREIRSRTGAVLVDNHLIANPIFATISIDRSAKVPQSVKEKVKLVWSAVLAAIAEDAPQGKSYVFTDVLLDNETGKRRYADVVDLAARRSLTFVPVRLRCDDDEEYARRVTDKSRVDQLKQTDLAISLERRATRPLLAIDHPNAFDVDVAPLTAFDAAQLIIAHAERLAS
jgi:hypothetical protein